MGHAQPGGTLLGTTWLQPNPHNRGEQQRGDTVFAFIFAMLPAIRHTDSTGMPAVLERGHPLQKS